MTDFECAFQKLQKQLEFLEVQEEYIKDELKNLKKEYLHAQEEVKRIQSVPLVIGQFLEAVDQNNGIVGSTTGTFIPNYYKLKTYEEYFLKSLVLDKMLDSYSMYKITCLTHFCLIYQKKKSRAYVVTFINKYLIYK